MESLPNQQGGHKWLRVSLKNPCPICGKPDWCLISVDGAVAACMRIDVGAFKRKVSRSGQTFHLHRLNGQPATVDARPKSTGQVLQIADVEVRHRVYSALLTALSLTAAHRESLTRRGLADAEMDRRGYVSLPVRGRARIAQELRERFDNLLLTVPGFYVKQSNARCYLTLAGAAGLLIPIRDINGRIIALKVRRDCASNGPRYSYLSSSRHGGPGPGSPVHVPLGVAAPCPRVRLTEGELKSDVATSLSNLPTISVAGVTNWLPCLDVLRALGAKTIVMAFDADAPEKAQVAQALSSCAQALASGGFAVELERWRPEHKGIDDLLTAGGTPELLCGPDAMAAIRAIADASGTCQQTSMAIIERLCEVLNGGPEALFRDRDLLRELAKLSLNDPAEYACCRAVCDRAKVKLRDLDRTLHPYRKEYTLPKPPPDAAACYRLVGGRIVREVLTRDGPLEVPLANFVARIVEEIIIDDGAERRLTLAIDGALSDGTLLPRVEVAAEHFLWMKWPVEKWGTRATVLAGAGTADHLRAAIQLLSGEVPTRSVFAHIGWREIDRRWLYLHAGGAIGEGGPVEGIDVAPPDTLAAYLLPKPPTGDELVMSVRAGLMLLDGLAPDRIVFPLVAAIYRAVLASADFALHLTGETGAFKTELAVLCQQHFGTGMDARHLPASWTSTGNALEGIAFAAKDALLTVDDFVPHGGAGDVQRIHREADRLLRAQGNRSGRGRMRPDGSLRPCKPPRGLILSTGEDVPRGQSLRSRMLAIEVSKGDVDLFRLTACQEHAGTGRYSAAMAGFVKWLAKRYATVQAKLPAMRAQWRDKAVVGGQHARTPAIVADLAIGFDYFLDFAVEVGAIDSVNRAELTDRGWKALVAAAEQHAEHLVYAEPCSQFLGLLRAALASGRAHVADSAGNEPDNAAAWGWRSVTFGAGSQQGWQPLGKRIGWVSGEDLYLEPVAAYAESQKLATELGEALPINRRTLWRRMREKGLLSSWDQSRQRNTARRSLEGVPQREVIHLRACTLTSCTQPSPPSTSQLYPLSKPQNGTSSVDGLVDGQTNTTEELSTGTVHSSIEKPPSGRCGRSDEGKAGSRRLYVLLPNGSSVAVASLDMAPTGATSWCWEGDSCWRPLDGKICQ
jgi:hypothetical protein